MFLFSLLKKIGVLLSVICLVAWLLFSLRLSESVFVALISEISPPIGVGATLISTMPVQVDLVLIAKCIKARERLNFRNMGRDLVNDQKVEAEVMEVCKRLDLI